MRRSMMSMTLWGLIACALAWGFLEFLALQRSRWVARLGQRAGH
jgi:hypothetical protein